jgi:hypothetical protein
MNLLKTVLHALICGLLLVPVALVAQTNCDEGTGPLNPAQPQGITPQQIIEKFGAKEEVFRQALNNYVYTQDITVQELDGNTVGGEFRLVQEITYDDKGGRVENVTFAPQNTLRLGRIEWACSLIAICLRHQRHRDQYQPTYEGTQNSFKKIHCISLFRNTGLKTRPIQNV